MHPPPHPTPLHKKPLSKQQTTQRGKTPYTHKNSNKITNFFSFSKSSSSWILVVCCLLSLSLSLHHRPIKESISQQPTAAAPPLYRRQSSDSPIATSTSSSGSKDKQLLIWSSFANPNNICQTFTTTNLYKLAASPKQATVLSTRHAQSLSLSLSASISRLSRARALGSKLRLLALCHYTWGRSSAS